MEKHESEKWFAYHAGLFPSWGQWVAAHDVIDAWQPAFARLNLADCMLVSKQMSQGRLDPIKTYDYETTPAIISREANAIRAARDAKQSTEATTDYAHRVRSLDAKRLGEVGVIARLGLGDAVRAYRECFERDDAEGCQRVLDGVGGTDDERGYRCLLCRDQGYVSCYSSRDVDAALQGVLDYSRPARTMSARCACKRGAAIVGNAGNKPPDQFDCRRHCQLGETRDWSALKQWLVDRQDIRHDRNYSQSLGAWNE